MVNFSSVQAISVEFANGAWHWEPLEADKLKILGEHLKQNPKDQSLRKIAKALPELGSYVTVGKLLQKLKKQKESR